MKITKTLLKKLTLSLNMGIRQALADEGGEPNSSQPVGEGTTSTLPSTTEPVTDSTHSHSSIDFESLIAKARKEEKEKLYPEITRLKEELEKKVARINELLLAIGEKDEIISQKEKEIKDLGSNSKKSESQEVKELKIQIADLENKLSEKDGEISFIKLDSYKQSKVAEAGGEIIPELVVGNSEEEIDLAIEKAKARYKEIITKVATTATINSNTQNSNNIPPVNPNTGNLDKGASTAMNLSGIDMMTVEGRAEYNRLRVQLGMK